MARHSSTYRGARRNAAIHGPNGKTVWRGQPFTGEFLWPEQRYVIGLRKRKPSRTYRSPGAKEIARGLRRLDA